MKNVLKYSTPIFVSICLLLILFYLVPFGMNYLDSVDKDCGCGCKGKKKCDCNGECVKCKEKHTSILSSFMKSNVHDTNSTWDKQNKYVSKIPCSSIKSCGCALKFKHANDSKYVFSPDCCPSPVTSSTGCLCVTPKIQAFINSRGNNKISCI